MLYIWASVIIFQLPYHLSNPPSGIYLSIAQSGPYTPTSHERKTMSMFGMRPSELQQEFPSKEDFDKLWTTWKLYYTSFRRHHGSSPMSGASSLHQSHSNQLNLRLPVDFMTAVMWSSPLERLTVLCFTCAGMEKDLLHHVGLQGLIRPDATAKGPFTLCDDFSTAQEPIELYTATRLHIMFRLPLADLQVPDCSLIPLLFAKVSAIGISIAFFTAFRMRIWTSWPYPPSLSSMLTSKTLAHVYMQSLSETQAKAVLSEAAGVTINITDSDSAEDDELSNRGPPAKAARTSSGRRPIKFIIDAIHRMTGSLE